MKRLRLIAALFSLVFGIGVTLAPAVTLADTPQSTVCSTLGSDSNCSTTPAGGVSIDSVIKAALELISFVVGLAATIMVIVSGYRYITSGGDSSKTAAAKNTLIYAIIGLVIAVLAQVIVKFILGRALGKA